MKKRKLFEELTDGFEALAAQRAGKRIARTHVVEEQAARRSSARALAERKTRAHFRRRSAGSKPEAAIALLDKLDRSLGRRAPRRKTPA